MRFNFKKLALLGAWIIFAEGSVYPQDVIDKLQPLAANGEVQFELPKPAPSHFAVRVKLSDKDWYCDCLTFVSTQEVIEKGFMSKLPESERRQSERVIGPRPGEIVLRAEPTPWWVRILYPLMKD